MLTETDHWVAVGGGARHLAVHPDGKHVFVNEEAGSKIICFDWDADTGTLTQKQSLSTLPEDFAEQVFTAECSLNADGDVLYVADRVWPPVPGKDDGLLATFGVGSGEVPCFTPCHSSVFPDRRGGKLRYL